MFCMECGQKLPSAAKFCSSCGVQVIGKSENGVQSSRSGNVGSRLVERALGTDAQDREQAKKHIIDSVDIESMKSCGRRALEDSDTDEANFWYLEWVTAPGISSSEAADAIFEFADSVLLPHKRFSEAELYLTWVAAQDDAAISHRATQALQGLHRSRGAHNMKRFRCSNEWRKVDVSQPLDPHWTGEMQHRRTIAWLEARSEQGDLAAIADPGNPSHLSYVAGMVNGIRSSSDRTGSNFEAQIQGLIDWIEIRVNQTESESAKSAAAAERAARPQKPPQAKASKPAPHENALGNHIDQLFSDAKLRQAIRSALNATSGLNDDFIVAAIPVSSKLGDYEDSAHYMIFTRDRAAIVKKGGLFSSAGSESFNKKMIDYVGVGDSDHYEGQGFGGRTTNWLSLTIQLRQGLSYTRHYFLGSSEKEVNSNIPFIRDAFERMGRVGYRIDSGPAWSSSGGYHTTYSYGFGIWR